MQQVKQEKVKTKVRFTSLDVAAMVAQLQVLVGLRVSNIYDLNPTTYIFKIAKSQQKCHLLVENGVRFHLTEQKPDKKTIPSGFTMRFRKFLRSKRVVSVRQVGVQRVVVISFGSETFANHLILELYSQGNIILTDYNYRILQCIRSHEFNDKVKTAVGEVYPFEHAANIYLENIDISAQALDKQLQPKQQPVEQQAQQPQGKKKGKGQEKGGQKVKDVVFKMIPCLFPAVIEHILTSNGLDGQRKIENEQGKTSALDAAKCCFDFLKNFVGKKQSGYLYSKGEEYFQFSPYPNCKLQKWPCLKQESFGLAVSEYFSKYKHSAHEQEQAFEQLAWKKYQQIRKDQEQRVKKLVQQQQTYGGKAELIERNVQQVQAVLKIIGMMEKGGYSWQAMQRMVAKSRKEGDPLANMIHSFNAPKRQITILLSDTHGEEADLCSLIPVELLVDYNAYTNATMYYEGRKKQQQKEQRTREASEQVLKLAEKDALKKIQKKKNQILLKAVPTRKQLWFQKFYWFVSSDGWLVISGRDSHQNELLVKRYMKPGDLYMHSDYGGAASTIIKGPPKAGPAPMGTLQQAAIFTVCRSKAWDTKIISSAWWVYHDQVSKSAPTGEFLPTGSFMIRGKRNFIHPNRMEMGFTLLYKLDNQSMQRRIEQKKELQKEMGEGETEVPAQVVRGQSVEENEEYAIIDLQAEARLAREKKKQKGKPKDKGKQNPPEMLKKQSSTVQQKKEQSQGENDDEEGSEQSDRDTKKQVKKTDKKGEKKVDKKKQGEQVQQKHKNRNKKKLKKLQKYLEEQDEDQRQIIMKMLGAKQMKHLQEEQQEQPNKDPNPKNKKDKKRGIDKYISTKQQEQQGCIDTNKVLFLKEKKKESSSEEDNAEIKEEPQLQNQVSKQKEEQPTQNQPQPQEKPIQQGEKQEDIADSEQQPQAAEKVEQKVEQEQVDEKVIDSEFSELNRLVGKVLGADKWDGLIPMCAPYPTIKDNRFKIKLVPGGLKKGKAARNIQSYYLTTDLDENEKAFVRALPEQEIINALIGNVKLAGAGLLKLEQKSKADKKEKRKEQDKKEKQ